MSDAIQSIPTCCIEVLRGEMIGRKDAVTCPPRRERIVLSCPIAVDSSLFLGQGSSHLDLLLEIATLPLLLLLLCFMMCEHNH